MSNQLHHDHSARRVLHHGLPDPGWSWVAAGGEALCWDATAPGSPAARHDLLLSASLPDHLPLLVQQVVDRNTVLFSELVSRVVCDHRSDTRTQPLGGASAARDAPSEWGGTRNRRPPLSDLFRRGSARHAPWFELPAAGDASISAALDPGAESYRHRALRIDRELWALAASEAAIERQLAFGLAQVWDGNLYRAAGSVRAVDYAREQLGLKEGKARWLAKLGRGLRAVPELDDAWRRGRLNASQVVELARVVGPETPAEERHTWIERATGLTVRVLRGMVRNELAERRRRRAESGGDGTAGDGAAGTGAAEDGAAEDGAAEDGAAGDGAAEDGAAEDGAAEDGAAGDGAAGAEAPEAGASNTGGAPPGSAPDAGRTISVADLDGNLQPGLNILDLDAPIERDLFSMPVPARVGAVWSEAVDLARRVGGYHAPLHQCVEWIAADFLARAGDEDPEVTERYERVYRRERCAAALARLMNGSRGGASVLDEILAAAAPGVTATIVSNSPYPARGAAGGNGNAATAAGNGNGATAAGNGTGAAAGAVAGNTPGGATASTQHAAASSGLRSRLWPDLCWSRPAGPPLDTLDGSEVTGARELTATLKQLIAGKRRLRLDLGERLEQLENARLWMQIGFASFDEYCEERLGASPRRAEGLIRFHRRLRRFRRIRRAYLRGALSFSAAEKLLVVVHPRTERFWVDWAIGLSCRDIDRHIEYAATFMLPGANAAVLKSYTEALKREVLASKGVNGAGLGAGLGVRLGTGGGAGLDVNRARSSLATTFAGAAGAAPSPGNGAAHPATTFAAATGSAPTSTARRPQPPLPLGWPLPPTSSRGKPRIAGLEQAISDAPEQLAARIRFWAPGETLQLLRRALRRCRRRLERPGAPDRPAHSDRPDWCFLEVVLVQFILEHDNPHTRRFLRQHPILNRDGFWCAIPGCTSRAHLEAHHIWMRSSHGPGDAWNLISLCKAHHDMVHAGTIELGGWAPWALIIRQGIDPRTGTALICYRNGRRTPESEVVAALARWKAWCRRRQTRRDATIKGREAIHA